MGDAWFRCIRRIVSFSFSCVLYTKVWCSKYSTLNHYGFAFIIRELCCALLNFHGTSSALCIHPLVCACAYLLIYKLIKKILNIDQSSTYAMQNFTMKDYMASRFNFKNNIWKWSLCLYSLVSLTNVGTKAWTMKTFPCRWQMIISLFIIIITSIEETMEYSFTLLGTINAPCYNAVTQIRTQWLPRDFFLQ